MWGVDFVIGKEDTTEKFCNWRKERTDKRGFWILDFLIGGMRGSVGEKKGRGTGGGGLGR